MDGRKSTISFEERKGFYIQRWVFVAGIAAALLCIVGVGLLVGYMAPCSLMGRASDLNNPDTQTKVLPYVRLPTSIVPVHYDLELMPYIEPNNFTFDGVVNIKIRVLEPTNNVTLHINNITVDERSLKLSGQNAPKIDSTSEDAEKQFYILHLGGELPKGEYQVSMKFLGSLNDQLVGFYRSAYEDENGKKRWIASTQFQPTDARRAFPCFDEPALKATFSIAIARPFNYNSISNMPRNKSIDRGNGWVVDYYEKTVNMSTYLLAFVVSDFQKKGTDKFGVWSRENVIDTTEYALEIGPQILEFYEKFFNISYPLPKMDMVALPDFSAGAMENWGLITYRETAMLYDRRYSSAMNKQRVATVISHELAHQWFGNLVTPAWWDDLWLNEGFASYIEYLGVNDVHPDWQMDQQFVLDDLQDVMDLDCLRTSHPISLPVRHPDEINEIFDRISYGKGASIIRMMKFFLGDSNFKTGLMNYLKAKAYSNAVQDDLWAYLTQAQTEKEQINVKTVMDSWTLQTGYPVVTLVRNYKAKTADLQQRRFLLDKGNTTDTETKWEVPFTYTDGGNTSWDTTTKIWLHKTNGVIRDLPETNQWVIGNIQEVGYYKVNYDDHNWNLLIQQFQDDHSKIHTINRAQIIDDSLDLARAGDLDYRIALNTTLYLKNEKDYLPWRTALHSFTFLDHMMSRSSSFGKFKKYLTVQLKPTYDRLGWDEKPNEDILSQYTRTSTLSWMCNYEYPDCIAKSQEKFAEWRKNPQNTDIISPNLRGLVYCIAARHGGEDVWDFLWQQYKAAQIASQKDKFMFALACAREPWLLTRYLNWTLDSDSGIRRQDGSHVFRSVGSKLFGRDLTFNYLRDKWNAVFQRYGKSFFAIGSIVKDVTSSLNTDFDLAQLKEFFDNQKHDLGSAKRAFEQSIENAEANVRWMKTNYQTVADWLDSVV